MTVEEFRILLNELVEEFPECRDNEVKISRWEMDDTFGCEVRTDVPVLDVEYLTDKKILVIKEDF